LGGTNISHDAQTGQKADKGRREITITGTGHKARVSIKGDLPRTAHPFENRSDRTQGRLGIEITASRIINQDGGAGVHHIQSLYHMLSFIHLLWGLTNRGHIFEIDLPDFHRFRQRQRLLRFRWLGAVEALMLIQYPPDGTGRGRQVTTQRVIFLLLVQVILDGQWTRYPVEGRFGIG